MKREESKKKKTFFVHGIIFSPLKKQITNDIPVITSSSIMKGGNIPFIQTIHIGTSFQHHMHSGKMTLKREGVRREGKRRRRERKGKEGKGKEKGDLHCNKHSGEG